MKISKLKLKKGTQNIGFGFLGGQESNSVGNNPDHKDHRGSKGSQIVIKKINGLIMTYIMRIVTGHKGS